MSRIEKLTFAKNLIAQYKNDIAAAEKSGAIEKGTYSWQECLADYTGIHISSMAELETLSDNALNQIVKAYI